MRIYFKVNFVILKDVLVTWLPVIYMSFELSVLGLRRKMSLIGEVTTFVSCCVLKISLPTFSSNCSNETQTQT